MSKNTSQVRKHTASSETKITEKYHRDLVSFINKKSEKKTHSLCFYLVKYFLDKKINSVKSDDLLNHVVSIFRKNPEALVTNSDEVFKNERGLKTTFTKLINKNTIFRHISPEKVYKLNEQEALIYLKSAYYYDNKGKDYKTPFKFRSRNKKLDLDEKEKKSGGLIKPKFKFKKEEEEDENITIKKEIINIKEEDKQPSSEESVQIKKEELKIKEESNEKEESAEDDEQFRFDAIIEQFNGKLYNDFFISFSEQGLYEQLQEKIEKLLEKSENSPDDKISNNINNNLMEQIEFSNKIKKIQTILNALNKNKERYDQLIIDFENKKSNMLLYVKLLKFKKMEMKLFKEINQNNELSKHNMIKEVKAIYDFDKKRHDFVFQQMNNLYNELKIIIQNARQNKINAKNEFIDLVENNMSKFENAHEFCELKENFKDNNSSIEKDISMAEKMFQKYNNLIGVFDDKMKSKIY